MASNPTEDKLNGEFFLDRQKQSNWCWAAIGVALAKYLQGREISQCRLVQATRKPEGVDCCTTPGHPLCNSIQKISSMLEEIGVKRRNHPEQPEDKISYDVIKSDIANNRPIICLMSGPGGDHYVVIVGWFVSDGKPCLIVDDPAQGVRKRTSFSDFFNFEGRKWMQTTRLA